MTMRRLLATMSSPAWVGVIFLLANIGFIGIYPIVSGDEIIGNDPARQFVNRGVIESSLFNENPGFGHCYFLQPPGQLFTGVAAYWTLGFGLWQTRFAALLWGAAAVAAAGILAVRWCGTRRAGWLAALMLAFNPEFTHTTAQARMDAQAICLLALGCLVFDRAVVAPEHARARFAWAGLLVGLAGITHAVSIFWAIALIIAILAGARGRVKGALADAVVFGAAAALPTGLWLLAGAMHPYEFVHQFMWHGRSKLTQSGPLEQLRSDASRWITKSYSHAPLLLVVLAGGVVWWASRKDVDLVRRRYVAVLALVTTFGTALLLTKDAGPFNLYPSVVLTAVAAGWLDRLLDWGKMAGGWKQFAVRGSLALLLVGLAASFAVPRILAALFQRHARDYSVVEAAVRRYVAPGDVVWGSPECWYAVEEAGGSLRLAGVSDPKTHKVLICSVAECVEIPPGFVLLATVGEELPNVMGRNFSFRSDYRIAIYGHAKPILAERR
jgi:4-amino-4-deoxy-L-arabinose transferase-like glycosyltransferase